MSYWSDRQEEMYKTGEMKVNQYYQKLEKAFNQTQRELRKTTESFYWRYAEENGLSYAAAQKMLDAEELGELKDFVDLAMQNIGKYNQKVNNMSIKARITRYQAMEAQVNAMLRQLYAVDYQAMAEQTMGEVYEDSYYRNWYNTDQYHGFHSAFAQIDPHTVGVLLEYPFNGANFSSRLWKQKDHLQTQLMEALTTMMVQGKNPQALAGEFAKKMNVKKFDAYRLLQTESSYLIGEATHAAYKEDEVEKYQILATLDSKTCGICGDLDGEVFEVGKEVVGENMWPFHCFCRCTDVPYYEDMDLSDMTRLARDPETGDYIDVSGDMTYREWKEEFINKGGKLKAPHSEKSERYAISDDIKSHRKDTPDKMVDLVDEYTEGDFVTIDETADDAFAYDLDTDMVVVNPKHALYENYNPAGVMIHEIAHRIDREVFGSPMNTEFSEALIHMSDRLLENREYYQVLFAPGGKMEYNEFISDIVSSVTHNEITGIAYHDLEYIQQFGNKELEVFADTFTVLYNGDGESVAFLKNELPELYRIFMKMVGVDDV